GKDFLIYDTDDQMAIVRQVLAELNVDSKKFNPGRVLNAISAAKNELIDPDNYSSSDYFGEIVKRAYPGYQAALVTNNALDFDDLLMQTAVLLRTDAAVREKYQARLTYILVDEFQDTNQAQFQLVKTLGAPQNNIFVVGDEDQGIYAFRGADYRNVLAFRQDYPEAELILLEQNYRSTQIVLDTARAVIDKNTQRTPKALFTEQSGGPLVMIHEAYSEGDEGEYIVDQIARLVRREKLAYREFAVMYRTNAQSRALEDAFVKNDVPYKLVGGVGFYRRREIRDLLAYLRLVNNANDTFSFTRVINVPARGIGKKSVETFQRWVADNDMTYEQAFGLILAGQLPPISGKARGSLKRFAEMLASWREIAAGGDLTALFDDVMAQTGYSLYLAEISDTDAQQLERTQNVKELRGVISDRKDLSLNDLLTELALVADVDSLDDSQDMVTLLTLHAAKGLEFPVVFITGLEDGLLPHSRSFNEPDAMAEERRLFYVGLTRAEQRLYLTYAFRRTLYGESAPGIPSRFLGDIPAELTEGGTAQVQNLRDRSAFEQETRWDRGGSRSGDRGGKVIRFEDAARDLRRHEDRGEERANERAETQQQMQYQAGQRVFHAKFGEGIVIESHRYGQDEEVTVRFEGYGVKRLAASFAKLTRLD
ncbi:MAG: UvrD-helicase domain-containing protein, partial [Chloroflexi bacterium]|nr:UvrD-helicase domain-containing protein [Chloroflexota bacterium]